MTDLVQRVANKTIHTQERSCPPHDELLALRPGNIPQTVLVSSMKTPDGPVPWFRLPEGQQSSTKGIWWQFPKDQPEYAMFITFQLAPEIVEVTSDTLWYSIVVDQKQQMCIPTGKATYHFDVEFPGGLKLDPQIVVTPITNI